MEIRRLSVDSDVELYRTAYSWDADKPLWYRNAEQVARLEFDKFIEEAPLRADIGVFEPEFTALISVLRRAPKIFEAHIWAKRGTDVESLGYAAFNLRHSLERELDMQAVYVWIVAKNRPVKRVCQLAGLQPDGETQIDGMSHGRPIEWIRLSYYGPQKTGTEHPAEYELQQR